MQIIAVRALLDESMPTKLKIETAPYIQVDNNNRHAYVYISRRGECPEQFDFIETNWDVTLKEQLGGAYIFTVGSGELVITSEIYWAKYTVWEVPKITLPTTED